MMSVSIFQRIRMTYVFISFSGTSEIFYYLGKYYIDRLPRKGRSNERGNYDNCQRA